MSTVFLSHSHADKPFARKLAASLRAAGHGVWIDEAEINIGDSLVEKIREGLDQVDYVAAILSSASIDSPWVTRELDIASNREIEEGRVVVLPLLVEKVDLPGFLKGKFYGDFTDESQYEHVVALLNRQLGEPECKPEAKEVEEIEALKVALAFAQQKAEMSEEKALQHANLALIGKSDSLKSAIRVANEKHPTHAAINNIHAFEAAGFPVVLDYLLWAIGKAARTGAHQLDSLITADDKWEDAKRMMQAYSDVIAQGNG
ncbi:toll/interleukin-1 receptor domain-containing protein [Enterovibrio norvegicus]|uniref:toll/interleukin-1 receptor domain-containing protein n=1 Tax=Enterovibrio norvegicus TaxID=188144 RepID=UPI000C839AEB|nr:toll/interleukin-1 receptor domain-containing protein [Enterovibrio norvegicus]PML77854.1 molecular chaperone Tir [Enterovibrio norvegicus]